MQKIDATKNNWTLKEATIWNGGVFAAMGGLLLLTLNFETIPLPINVQIIPLASLLSLLFLPFALQRVPRTPLLTAVALFASYALIHSSIGLFVDALRGDQLSRLVAWIRQIAALIAGVSLFVVLRKAFLHLSNRQVLRYVIIASLPGLLLAILNILWGGLQQAWAGKIVVAIRDFIAPLGYTAPLRASGISLEPATFSVYLAIIVLPLLFVLFADKKRRRFAVALLMLTLVSFVWTFSTTGVIVLFVVLFGGLLFGPKRALITKIGATFLCIIVAALLLFPNNQIFRHARTLIKGKASINISFADRFYSTAGPFMTSFSSFTMLGYGLGGTVSHFDEIVPASVQKEIATVKWKNLPNLGTLVGRIFAEIGAVGFCFFLIIVGSSFWELQKMLRLERDPRSRLFLLSARLGLFGAFFSLTIAFGSFHIPYFWFWMALIDARYFSAMTQKSLLAAVTDG